MVLRVVCAAAAAAMMAAAGPAPAAVLAPTDLALSTPAGGTSPASPYTDDVYLDTLAFGGTVFSAGDLRAARSIEVLSGRDNINAEWGDTDTAADGDPDPFTKAGLDPAEQEMAPPAAQDAALLEAFDSLSLSEIIDGEDSDQPGFFSFRLLFSAGLLDNDTAPDDIPEIVLFERGRNDVFTLELILGGTPASPVLSDPLTVNSADFAEAGFSIDTTEIGGAQGMGVGGLDLNDFELSGGEIVYGFVFTQVSGGPDLGGAFLSGADGFAPPLDPDTAVPLPAAGTMLLGGLAALGTLARRRRG
jgi:hypothetical protein